MNSANSVFRFPSPARVHELDSRVSDAIHVRLLWDQGADRLTVAVDDAKTGDAFTIDVRACERPLDVFHHPYAYAAVHGIETRTEAPLATQPGRPGACGQRHARGA